MSVMIALMTLALFWPVYHHDFIAYDDGAYIVNNPMINHGVTWEGIQQAFTKGHFFMWHPLTSFSHMLDCEFFGLNPGPAHLENALWHSLSAGLLFLLLRRMTGAFWQCVMVAALFAWHPLRVESVAWAAERKDVLCTLFWLLTFHAYVTYIQSPGKKTYALLLATYALGIMTKPMIITLPCVLLLLDFWPLKRLDWPFANGESNGRTLLPLIKEKLPLFGLSLALGVVSFVMQHGGEVVVGTARLPLSGRVENALISYVRYLYHLIWPQDLIVFYPHPLTWPLDQVLGAALMLVAITVVVWKLGKNHPYLMTGWAWFLGTLVPVIGLVQAGAQSMADRYTYVPLIGLFIMLVWGLGEMTAKMQVQKLLMSLLAGFVIATCLLLTHRQLTYWKDTETLFKYVLTVSPDNYVAHTNLGYALASQDKIDEALVHYDRALEIKPNNSKLHYELALALESKERTELALKHYQSALEINPDYADAHYHLAILLGRLGRKEEAIQHQRQAFKLKPSLQWNLAPNTSPASP